MWCTSTLTVAVLSLCLQTMAHKTSVLSKATQVVFIFPVIIFSIALLPQWFYDWGLDPQFIVTAISVSFGLDAIIDPFLCFHSEKLVEQQSVIPLYTIFCIASIVYAGCIYMLLSGDLILNATHAFANIGFVCFFLGLTLSHSIVLISKQALNTCLLDISNFGASPVENHLGRRVSTPLLCRLVAALIVTSGSILSGSFNDLNSDAAADKFCSPDRCVSHRVTADVTGIPVGYGVPCTASTLFEDSDLVLIYCVV